MARLFGFDYKSPYFYMVTLKRLNGIRDFSTIGPHELVENEITQAFSTIIRTFHRKWRCLDEISPFIVMPDHIHLMIKINAPIKSLPIIVWQLKRTLTAKYWQVTNGLSHSSHNPSSKGIAMASCASTNASQQPLPPIFEKDWHDWIVKKRGQLSAFRRYIKENPSRAWLRYANRQYFGRVCEVEFCGRKWFAYGNTAILDLPIIIPFKCSRKLVKDSKEWNVFVETASRLGPGGAGVSTFMSPCEKECGNLIAKAGGKWIVLSPEGFGARWHPPRDKEKFCAQGRMLFLSLYPADTHKPDKATLYQRCHEMGDIFSHSLLTPSA